ncbi:MAG: replication-associated recombination protein A [Bacteroidota bacterium]
MNLHQPLAERVRPKKLSDVIGQKHLIGPAGPISTFVGRNSLPSLILWGPPGVGKTTIASLLAGELGRDFYPISAVHSGVKDVREVIDRAKHRNLLSKGAPVLFIDEIHRFSKSQQDALLHAVENGWVTLVGATTENPSFEVIAPLLSRCQVYVLQALTSEELMQILLQAMEKDAYLQTKNIFLDATDALFRASGGDARKLLNIFDLLVQTSREEEVHITDEQVMELIQKKQALYDKSGEQHYDIISAFIKSMRGSDPNAAVYWLARMIEGGEDPIFIARRMLVFASEDIGNANPTALVLATACFDAVHKTGMPEGRIILSQTAVYLSSSVKSNASYVAIEKALSLVKKTGDLPVPMHLRNAPTSLMKELGYGDGYKYAHDFVAGSDESLQEFLPNELAGTSLYQPGNNAREEEMRKYLYFVWREKYGYG